MDFYEYVGKEIILTDKEGKQWEGLVYTYEPAIDNDDGLNWISLKIGKQSGLVSFSENEIEEIEVIK